MEKIYSNIAVLVAFNRNTDAYLKKVTEMAGVLDCHLHLIHVIYPSLLQSLIIRSGAVTIKSMMARRKYKVHQLQSRLAPLLKAGLKLFTVCINANDKSQVASYTETHEIDMLWLDGEQQHYSLSNKWEHEKLPAQTKCPVMALKYLDAGVTGTSSIVLPVSQLLAVHHIRAGIYMAKKFQAAIHLITVEKNNELEYMKKVFSMVKDNTDVPVVCKTMAGENLQAIAMMYARKAGAAMLIINPAATKLTPVVNNSYIPGNITTTKKITGKTAYTFFHE